jgi:exopolyphosphatase/guanosine-5'-triphosphate,3'-diphosphate pyrophosphatase
MLALSLFDGSASLHEYALQERNWLAWAALLHDIGWDQGRKGHHKRSATLILAAPELEQLKDRERGIIAAVARYHRKALPQPSHALLAPLDQADRERVRLLAGILRVADGLDRSHRSVVRKIGLRVLPDEMQCTCETDQAMDVERTAALKKSDLFGQVFNRKLTIWTGPAR